MFATVSPSHAFTTPPPHISLHFSHLCYSQAQCIAGAQPSLLGRKAMTNLDSVLKSRDITLPTKVPIVKSYGFPVVMYGCESRSIKKPEGRRIDTFKLCCWRRLLRVPWTARRPNQSILKEVNPEYSLKVLMLKLKLQCFGHLMGRAASPEKTLMLGKTEGKKEEGEAEDEAIRRYRPLKGQESEQTGRWWRTGSLAVAHGATTERLSSNSCFGKTELWQPPFGCLLSSEPNGNRVIILFTRHSQLSPLPSFLEPRYLLSGAGFWHCSSSSEP